MIAIAKYVDAEHGAGVREVLRSLGWEQRYVDGQLTAIASLSAATSGRVLVASTSRGVVGYVTAEFEQWNRLGQIQGLVVAPSQRRSGVASSLVEAVEEFLREQGARGVRVDTPVDNTAGRLFYEAAGFSLDYVMTRYYADDLDGVTYVRFFDDEDGATWPA